MPPPDPRTLTAAIEDLRQRLDGLPDINSAAGNVMEQHRRHRQAEDQLADYLARTYGARIHRKAWTNQVRMLGIASSGTCGVTGALRNWLAAAGRRLERQGLNDA